MLLWLVYKLLIGSKSISTTPLGTLLGSICSHSQNNIYFLQEMTLTANSLLPFYIYTRQTKQSTH
jgi:hypothetical protein